jgi:hypothetical protein
MPKAATGAASALYGYALALHHVEELPSRAQPQAA